MTSPAPDQSWDPHALEISRRLAELVRTEIAAAGGLLPFDCFMELALYAPGLGYYVGGAQKLGAGGDFITAPEISPLFGACVAAQCAEALERLGGGDILEFGPGSGILAVGVLAELDRLGTLPERYLLLEPSPDLAARQRATVAQRLPDLADRCHWLERLPRGLRAVVLANEVLDAMPVHRFRIAAEGAIEECFVRDGAQGLLEIWAPARSAGLREAVSALQADGLAASPGYCSEVNLRLGPWLKALGEGMEAGLVLLIDYGYPRGSYYQQDRAMGTMMCHLRHRAHDNPYRHLGLQDITAHVDFSAASSAGRAAGFELAGFATQAHFLMGCGIDSLLETANARASNPSLLLGVKQLMLPSAMGERFKVLGLARDIAGPWRGFAVRDLSDRL